MTKEATIDRVIQELESEADTYEQQMEALATAQPHLLAFVTHDDNDAFTEEEQRLLLFATLVIYRSTAAEDSPPPPVPAAKIEQGEEANYAIMQAAKGNFRTKLDPFFAITREEDLLAFIEDLISGETEEDTITKEAREPLFIALKTVVDVLA